VPLSSISGDGRYLAYADAPPGWGSAVHDCYLYYLEGGKAIDVAKITLRISDVRPDPEPRLVGWCVLSLNRPGGKALDVYLYYRAAGSSWI